MSLASGRNNVLLPSKRFSSWKDFNVFNHNAYKYTRGSEHPRNLTRDLILIVIVPATLRNTWQSWQST